MWRSCKRETQPKIFWSFATEKMKRLAREHKMQLMQMIMSAQMQDSEHFLSRRNSQQYGYSYPSQHSYQYIESGNMAPNCLNLWQYFQNMFKLLFIPIKEPDIMLQVFSCSSTNLNVIWFEKVLLSSEDRNSERQSISRSPCLSISWYF